MTSKGVARGSQEGRKRVLQGAEWIRLEQRFHSAHPAP